jgi:hypothetical protein
MGLAMFRMLLTSFSGGMYFFTLSIGNGFNFDAGFISNQLRSIPKLKSAFNHVIHVGSHDASPF